METNNIARHFRGVIDSTLREGLQFSRADLDLGRQLRVFRFLERIGVDFVEVGNPVQADVRDSIGELLRRRERPSTRVLSHIRNLDRDLAAAAATGVEGVNILCTADPERLAGMGCAPGDYLRRLEANIGNALEAGLIVRVSVEDYFNRPGGFSLDVYRLASACGVHRLGLADTLGRALGWDVRRTIRTLRRSLSTEIEVHFHNDFGHAVSNALAALEAGANWVSTSLLGIGERTGITPLSTLLVNLHLIRPALTARYSLGDLTGAENYVAEACGMDVPLHLMTSPLNGFAHKAGIHLDALIRFGPGVYEPIPPALIGNLRRMILHSPISGKTSEADVSEFNRKFGA